MWLRVRNSYYKVSVFSFGLYSSVTNMYKAWCKGGWRRRGGSVSYLFLGPSQRMFSYWNCSVLYLHCITPLYLHHVTLTPCYTYLLTPCYTSLLTCYTSTYTYLHHVTHLYLHHVALHHVTPLYLHQVTSLLTPSYTYLHHLTPCYTCLHHVKPLYLHHITPSSTCTILRLSSTYTMLHSDIILTSFFVKL